MEPQKEGTQHNLVVCALSTHPHSTLLLMLLDSDFIAHFPFTSSPCLMNLNFQTLLPSPSYRCREHLPANNILVLSSLPEPFWVNTSFGLTVPGGLPQSSPHLPWVTCWRGHPGSLHIFNLRNRKRVRRAKGKSQWNLEGAGSHPSFMRWEPIHPTCKKRHHEPPGNRARTP